MQKEMKYPAALVYGLDIGTRSIVGTVGYQQGGRFYVVAQKIVEHETRAMIDGQIHDINAVGERIKGVTGYLEEKTGVRLKAACIAAAGRVLRTVTTHVEIDLEGEKVITKEDIFALDSYGVERAFEEFQEKNDLDMKFYCVGYSVVKYYMNHYPIQNLENHKAKVIAADLIATFLPDDVVDGLYRSVDLAGLEVANLTLEPIAAMEVAIPEMYRMLNIALIDVGAGTSDISVTKDGSIVAYGMLPMAGDGLTEIVARHCLVDFITAEEIKKGITDSEEVEYKDIMGTPQKIRREEVLSILDDLVDDMAKQAAEKITELNCGKPVSAVFVVGGGGKVETYTGKVAKYLEIAPERCALRGEEVLKGIEFLEADVVKDSLLVTPIGICLNYYQQSNNFIFVTFNKKRIKLYDNSRLAIVDAAIQAEFPNKGLFPKKGTTLEFTVNGKQKAVRGEVGEPAVITLNGEPADIYTQIRANDVISVTESTAGDDARMEIGQLAEYNGTIAFYVNEQHIEVPKFASVNGQLQSQYYEICQNDKIELLNYYTVQQIADLMDVILDAKMNIYVNNVTADLDTKVYENFSVVWTLEQIKAPAGGGIMPDTKAEPAAAESERTEQQRTVAGQQSTAEQPPATGQQTAQKPVAKQQTMPGKGTSDKKDSTNDFQIYSNDVQWKNITYADLEAETDEEAGDEEWRKEAAANAEAAWKPEAAESEEEAKPEAQDSGLVVIVNGRPIQMSGKKEYIYVDVFSYIDFDLSKPQGSSVETTLNGRKAQYLEPLQSGDRLEIYWKD